MGLDYTASGAQISFRLNTTSTSDELLVTGGSYTQSSGTLINLANGGSFGGVGTYNLIDVSALGNNDVTLADYTLGTTIAGYTETLAVNAQDDILQVQVSAAPEPSPLAMVGGGLLLLGVVMHRRSKFVV